MFGWLTRSFERFIGAGDAALTVPVMDGALKPNRVLDECVGAAATRPDNLARHGDQVVFTSERELRAFDPSRPAMGLSFSWGSRVGSKRWRLPATAASPSRSRRANFVDRRAVRWSRAARPEQAVSELRYGARVCRRRGSGHLRWLRDPFDRPLAKGSPRIREQRIRMATVPALVRGDPALRRAGVPLWAARRARGGKARGQRELATSSSAPRRSRQIQAGDRACDLPGYPARLCENPAEGAWLAIFAPRNPLVEFVIREPEYQTTWSGRFRLTTDRAVPPQPEFVPRTVVGRSRAANRHAETWPPTRSYGLVVRLGRDLQPIASFHSRADGKRHGIASCLVDGGRLLAASKGGTKFLFVQ